MFSTISLSFLQLLMLFFMFPVFSIILNFIQSNVLYHQYNHEYLAPRQNLEMQLQMPQLSQDKIQYSKPLILQYHFLLVTIQIFITFPPPIHAIVGYFVIKLKLEIPPQMQQHIQHYQSVLAIARWDTSSCYFIYSKPFILWNLYPSHHCHLWFNLEMLLPKPNGSNRIIGSRLFLEDNFECFFRST